MEAADPSSTSSKVIVECSDQYGLLDQILPKLESLVPLGNLHWKSPSRPLRSIDKLDVSFTREEKKPETPILARRHQIPGLRQTPFVKLLLVRCDDRDSYKDLTRKQVKQWLKDHGLSSDGKSTGKGQEGHDAFEHILLHVVLPDTPAAGQPKSSKHASMEATDSTDSLNKGSKWTGKTSSTVFDKLKADFSSSSKSPFERVAQVRLTDPGKPSSALSPSEIEELWQDLVEKLKSAILQSFGARVAQYEEDIRDRDNQRSLPGWNFCTFFILKEGLARGFENVGLLEDALTVYNELDAGLDDIVQAQASREVDSAGALLPFAKDLKQFIRNALETTTAPDIPEIASMESLSISRLIELERKSFPFDIDRLDYQQRILTNQVSALDLRIYIFARKLKLLLRRAKNTATPAKTRMSVQPARSSPDVNRIAEVCEQAAQFVSFASRALRRDLYAAWGGRDELGEAQMQSQEQVVGNLVSSWKIAAVMQILDECRVLDLMPDRLTVGPDDLDSPDSLIAETGYRPQLANGHAERPTSGGSNKHVSLGNRPQSVMIPLTQTFSNGPRPAARKDGYERLALWVAELLVTVRDIISSVNPAAQSLGLPKTPVRSRFTTEEADLSREGSSGLTSRSLSISAGSAESCAATYKLLTIHAYQCYELSKQVQALRQMLLGLARIEISSGKREQALRWLDQIRDVTGLEAQTLVDLTVLTTYADCLDYEQQPSEYVKIMLAVLTSYNSRVGKLALASAGIVMQDCLNRLVEVAPRADPENLALDRLIRISKVDSSITQDGHGFVVNAQVAMQGPVTLRLGQSMTLKLAAVGSAEPAQVCLSSSPDITLTEDPCTVSFRSTTAASGRYELDCLEVHIGSLVLAHDFRPAAIESDLGQERQPRLSMPMMLYHNINVPVCQIRQSSVTDLAQPRHLDVEISTRAHRIETMSLRMKPATAGMRLDLGATKLREGSTSKDSHMEIVDGVITLTGTGLSPERSVAFEVPYSVENSVTTTVEVKIELSYTLDGTPHVAHFLQSMSTILPLTVNVQDIFHADTMFSKFAAGPATSNPITVISWHVDETEGLHVRTSQSIDEPVQAFPRSPANWVAHIHKKSDGAKLDQKLPLRVKYQCLAEISLNSALETFQTALTDSPFEVAARLLLPQLALQLPRKWTEEDMEAAALLREVRMPSFDAVAWSDVLGGLGAHDRNAAHDWLQEWHAKHETVRLDASRAPTRTLKLLVDIPVPSLVVATRLRLPVDDLRREQVMTGVPLLGHLVISSSTARPDVEILYEVTGHSDTWLIGGRKRGILHAQREAVDIPVMLIPQRPGTLLLPSIDIRCRQPHTQEGEPAVSLEVDNQSQAQSVLAIPAVQNTTIAFGAGADGVPTHWTLATEYRASHVS